jgi:hypothetical protein
LSLRPFSSSLPALGRADSGLPGSDVGRHMVFALDRDSGELLAFSSPAGIDAQCKRIDVKDGFWLFFDEDGSPLEARFEHVNQSEDSPGFPGAYTLQRPMSGLWLQERIAQIVTVKGCGPTTVEELVETLKINRSKRVAGIAKRG